MALDDEDRVFLEKTIDTIIKQVPDLVKMARVEEYKEFVQYKDEGDLVLGLALGMIYGAFVQYFVTRQQRQANPDEVSGANQVIFRRMREIKDAIFNCG